MKVHDPVPCQEKIPYKYRCLSDGVKFHPDVAKLINHERNNKVAFIKNTETFQYVDVIRDKVVTAKGITKILKGAFFENYEPVFGKEARKRSRQKNKHLSRQTQLKEKLSAEQMLARKVRDKRIKGFTLGNVVHDELCSWARSHNEQKWMKENPVLNAFTIKVMRSLRLLKIEPIYAEWPIFDENVPYATSIDMVGVSGNADGSLVVIEIKTGYEGYFFEGNANMNRTPLKRVVNSPKNQALLQCLMAMLTLKYRYGINRVFGMVIRVSGSGVDAEPIPEPFLKKGPSIYKGLCDYMLEKGYKKENPIQKMTTRKNSYSVSWKDMNTSRSSPLAKSKKTYKRKKRKQTKRCKRKSNVIK